MAIKHVAIRMSLFYLLNFRALAGQTSRFPQDLYVMARILILTYEKLPELSEDDRLLRDVLIASGHEIEVVLWDSFVKNAGATLPDLVLVRSIWDYHKRIPEFLILLDRLEGLQSVVMNAVPVMRWNLDKGYLQELEQIGFPVIPTQWLNRGETLPFKELMRSTGWLDVVVKPRISASAMRTKRVRLSEAEHFEPVFRRWLSEQNLLIQPFQQDVLERGEWSLLFFGGRFSHAVLKKPRAGDFRVQAEYGGTTLVASAPQEFLELGNTLMEWLNQKFSQAPVFVRIDLFDIAGHPVIGELELIEPFLFLGYDTNAPERFASAILS
jgi:glutathione synthase/RimK-type ligase-like ATP-grasp enzyme